ncbi:MAG: Yip1 family protein, partial [Bacillota bacterium]
EGKYDSSLEKWNKVLSDNGNFEYAYTGLGLGYLREDNYSRAMKKFKRGNNRNFYSDALQYYRREVIESNFDIVFYSLIFLIIMLFFFVRFGVLEKIKEKGYLVKLEKEKQKYSKKFINALSFSIHLIFHPFGGFWELKEEKRGNIISASVLLLLVIASYVFVRQYTGFIFNKRDLNELNILFEAATIIIPFLLWCTVNWSLTTLMEGKGNFKEISISTAYALTPLIILNFPITIISDYLIQEEGMFYYAFLVLAVFWTSCLLFFGMMTIHEYTLPKTFFTTILTIIGIGIVLFIGLLFYSVVNQLVQFITDIYAEIVFRI